MEAMIYDRYGPPEVLHSAVVPMPGVKTGSVVIKVHSSSVTTADWRIRASAFPPAFWLVGRLMFGLFRPKRRILGNDFAGVVVETGTGVTRFKIGDRVFGFSGGGSNAEFLAMPEDGAIAALPASLGFDEGAALPFGALSALVFLRDVARVAKGQKILIVGASGGVGSYAVQIAKSLGAEVTGVASSKNLTFLSQLGADHVIDYEAQDFTFSNDRYDLVFDTVGAIGFSEARRILSPRGLFVPLNFGLKEIAQSLWARLFGRQQVMISVSGDTMEDMEELKHLVERGEVRPVIDRRYPLSELAIAHRYVESRHRRGSVVVSIAG